MSLAAPGDGGGDAARGKQDKDDKLINVRFKEKFEHIIELVPRSYQDELYRLALRENIIVFLGTGLGKTYITVLYIRSPQVGEELQKGRKVVFLAPTQDLIKQQAEYIYRQVPYRVKIFCGRTAHCGEHIDHWNESTWAKELEKVDLLFMTPMIFANAISTNLLDWRQIAAVIFDEFHHACRPKRSTSTGSPYRHILLHHKDYFANKYDQNQYPRPRLIGLTASLINTMPKDRDWIRGEVTDIERLVQGRCVTNMEVLESKPSMIIHSFSPFEYKPYNDLLTDVLKDLKNKLDDVLKNKQMTGDKAELAKIQTYHIRLLLAARGLSIKPGSFPKIIEGLVIIRQRCGLWGLENVSRRIVLALDKPSAKTHMSNDTKSIYTAFTEMLRELNGCLKRVLQPLHAEQALIGYANAKSVALLDVLRLEYQHTMSGQNDKDTFSCIIFVRSRLEVTALCQWLQHVSEVLPQYKFIKCDYAIGLASTMSSKYSCITKRKPAEQSQMLEKFRKGELNVIVTTSVLEEGIDLPVCSTVIRYDSAGNFREYVQSRGRARQKISTFVTMSECAKKDKTQLDLNKLNDFEVTLKELLGNHDVRNEVMRRDTSGGATRSASEQQLREIDVYSDPDKSVRITGGAAKIILHMYCQQLSKNTPFTEKVRYDRERFGGPTYQTTIWLPSGCPLESAIKGNLKSSATNADNSALVAVIRALVEAKELSPKGIPFRINEENLDELLRQHELQPNFEPIESNDQFGLSEKDGEREFFKYKLRSRAIDDYISKDFRKKFFRLVPIKFVGADQSVRLETKNIMEAPVYGLIFDNTYDTSFIPEFIHTHYGKFEVFFRESSENFTIDNMEHHYAYLNYTHKLLTRCLGISRLQLEEFRYHCQSYIVPLNQQGLPDQRRMDRSFRASNYRLRVGDVVKMRRFYMGDNRQGRDQNKMMIVRGIRRDLNPRSPVPGKRDRVTFAQDAEYRYGQGIITDPNQVVIEVMPLASEFGRTDAGKRRSAQYRTESLFYLEQFLEFFDDDAAAVIQAFNFPEIFYRLYHHVVAADLDKKFLAGTQREREAQPPVSHMGNLDMASSGDAADPERESSDIKDPELPADVPGEVDGEEADVEDEEEDNELDLGSDSEIEQDDTDYEEDSDDDGSDRKLIRSYEDMIMAKKLDLMGDDEDSKEHMKRWDFDSYSEKDLKTMEFTHRTSYRSDATDLDHLARSGSVLEDLRSRLEPYTEDLITQLENYELKVLGEGGAYDDDADFSEPQVLVDASIEPPVTFAGASTPLLAPSSRLVGILESLTLRSARQHHSLEALENVGDSYLKYLVSVVVYQNLEGNEGILTSIRSRLICNKHFSHLARKMRLGTYAIQQPFSKERLAYVLGQETRHDEEAAFLNKLKSKDLADMFESIVGSYLVYQGEFEANLAIEWLGLRRIFRENTFAERSAARIALARPSSDSLADQQQLDQGLARRFKTRAAKVEKILGYKFTNSSYLIQALTHASYIEKWTRSYERLEYLGDAVLDYLTTMTLFRSGIAKDPGQITASRSALVNNCAFARLTLKYRFDQYLLFFNHEIFDELVKVRLTLENDPELSFFDLVEFDGVVKLLGDLFESIAGAIYLDSGCSLDAVWKIYYAMMKDSIDQELSNPSKNHKQLLHETFPGKGRVSYETYDLKTEDGQMVGVRCIIKGFGEFEGRGLRRSQAQQRAVQAALANPPSAEEKERLDKEFAASQPPRASRGRAAGNYRGRGGGGRGSFGGHRGASGGRRGRRGYWRG